MFKWFDKWLAKRARRGLVDLNNEEEDKNMLSCVDDGERHLHRNPKNAMHFTIYSANGGHVLEYHKYNERNDEDEYTLHLIPNDNDVGQSISHVITLEMLRK